MLCRGSQGRRQRRQRPLARGRVHDVPYGSETYVSQPNRSTSTPVSQGELGYTCYAEYLRDDVNAGSVPRPEVAFVVKPGF